MSTPGAIIRRLLPSGSHPNEGESNWDSCPDWPPDAFAVAATLLERSGMYAAYRYSGSDLFDKLYPGRVRRWARKWSDDVRPPQPIQTRWKRILAKKEQSLESLCRDDCRWWDNVFELLAAVDEASVGVGFPRVAPAASSKKSRESLVALVVLAAYEAMEFRRRELLPAIPRSVCMWVQPNVACVLPKSRTSQVGYSLSALSHHLALLPPDTEVQANWLLTYGTVDAGPLNLLLVPFPYAIHGTSFRVANEESIPDTRWYRLRIEQDWLSKDCRRGMGPFLQKLITIAEREVGQIHGLVMPELALDDGLAESVAEQLRRKNPGLELFISGITATRSAPPVNAAFLDIGGHVLCIQRKHHRWKVDGGQIRRYHLGHAMRHTHSQWLEDIDIARRSLNFALFRPGATICTVVCEDLARVEPVQPVLRSVGPNLVIALLMDGPQLEHRWACKYATALCDDPGSAVLTLTSLGMVRRTLEPGARNNRQVALWREPGNSARELLLPSGAHALAVTINTRVVTNRTMDGRADGGLTIDLSLGAVHPISHPSPKPWARVVD